MKIEIQSILGIRAASITVAAGEVLEVVGPNAAGKTSVATCLQALLAREANPLGLSISEQRQYLHDGEGEGFAWLTPDDADQWAVEWCPTRSEGAIATDRDCVSSHEMAVGLVDFTARMAAKTRAGLLQPILLPPPDVVLDKLREELKPYLPERDIVGCVDEIERRGFEAAEKVYIGRSQEAKRQWCAITGRRAYGSKIATDWRPEGWTADHDALTIEEAERAVDVARGERDELLREVAVSEAALLAAEAAKEKMPALNEALHKAESEAEGHRDAETTAKDALVAAQAPLHEKRDAVANLDTLGRTIKTSLEAGSAEPPHRCPECNAPLHLPSGRLVAWVQPDAADVEAKLAEMRKSRATLMTDMNDTLERERVAEEHVRVVREQRAYAEQALSDARSAARSAQSAAAVKGVPDDEHRRQRRARADERIEGAQKVKEAVSAAKRAAAQADSVEHYQSIVRALGPSGVRAGLLGARLRKLQGGLHALCEAAGWPSVDVTAGGAITVGKRAVQLCSGAERKIAQVSMQLTIAAITGSAAVVIDEWRDGLDPDIEAGFVKAVLLVISKTPVSVLLFAPSKLNPSGPFRQALIVGGRTVDPETGETAE